MKKTFTKKIEVSEKTISIIEKNAIDMREKKQKIYGQILDFAIKNWAIIFKKG